RKAHENLLDEIERQIEDLEEEIEEHIEEDSELMGQCSLLETIPGVGLQTAAIVAGELGSPEQFENARQAAAYAGLVPRHRESGTSVRGNPRMSKVPDGRLRRAMYFPAMTALRFNSATGASATVSKSEEKRKWSWLERRCGSPCIFATGFSNPAVPSTPRCILGPDYA
ncbi:IS110 family transposase, partial [Salinibacter ruber]|uniref:IS110 family transposase n=1 Tax=Salinibacter ruber TaxID=146919 RepID=UPI00216893F9